MSRPDVSSTTSAVPRQGLVVTALCFYGQQRLPALRNNFVVKLMPLCPSIVLIQAAEELSFERRNPDAGRVFAADRQHQKERQDELLRIWRSRRAVRERDLREPQLKGQLRFTHVGGFHHRMSGSQANP